ncbi:MAG: formate/nitrite transporter family protein [Bacilli bacterium]
MIEDYIELGIKKVNNKKINMFILGILAGLFIGLASLLATVCSYTLTGSIAKVLAGLVFPIGLSLVVLFKTELFTGNSLLVIPLLDKKIKLKQLLLNWLIVYLGNLVGSFLLALLIYLSGIITKNQELGISLINIAINKTTLTFTNAIILGSFCNILVCASIYLCSSLKTISEKIMVIFLSVFMFVALGFEHSVANMYYLITGLFLKFDTGLMQRAMELKLNIDVLNVKTVICSNLWPVTIGNIIGGTLLGFILWYIFKKRR